MQTTKLTQHQVSLVRNWDMTKVKRCLHQKTGMPLAELESLEREYKNYLLAVAATVGTDIPVSEPVDEFWHTHMLFSADYSDLTHQLLGYDMDHYPILDEAEHIEALPVYLQLTIPTLERITGYAPSEAYWPRNRCICYGGGKRSMQLAGKI